MWDDQLYFRRYNYGWQNWRTAIDSATIGSQSVNYATTANTANTLVSSATVNELYNNGWFRAKGSSGFFFQDHGGGWYMTDDTWIRSYGSKNIYQDT